jgi:hypothetical protein
MASPRRGATDKTRIFSRLAASGVRGMVSVTARVWIMDPCKLLTALQDITGWVTQA